MAKNKKKAPMKPNCPPTPGKKQKGVPMPPPGGEKNKCAPKKKKK